MNRPTGPTDGTRGRAPAAAEQPPTSAKDFFTAWSIEKLAAAQGVRPLGNPDVLAGGWPEGEKLDEFLEKTYRDRSI